jgi:uncharacterized protein YunC (DUF1805 family)
VSILLFSRVKDSVCKGFAVAILLKSFLRWLLERIYMINVTPIKIDDKTAVGVKVDLPESPPLLLVMGERGFVMCGFLKMDAAEKLNVTAAMVSGVKSFDDVLEAEVKAVTSEARKKGIKPGMTGKEALKLL